MRQAKATHYENEFSNKQGDIKGTWQIINKNIKNQVRSHEIIIQDDGVRLDKKNVSCRFMSYFAKIPFITLRNIIPVYVNPLFYLKNRSLNTFFMGPIIDKDIETAILSLKNCNGVHAFSTLVLKESIPVISEHLSYIFNLCTKQGYFPVELKTGCISPIYKKGDKCSIENYRPICSLSQFSKIFEKVVYKNMMKFILKNKIISNSQYGFLSNKSTESALIDFTMFIRDY